jgi:hypothetical protein
MEKNTQSTLTHKHATVPGSLSEVPANTWQQMVDRMISGK